MDLNEGASFDKNIGMIIGKQDEKYALTKIGNVYPDVMCSLVTVTRF